MYCCCCAAEDTGGRIPLASNTTFERQNTGRGLAVGRHGIAQSSDVSPLSFEQGRDWIPKEGDIIIVGHRCTGLSLVSFTAYLLKAKYNLQFSSFEQVVPWIQSAHDCDIDLDSFPEPRLFISHQRLSMVNSGGRYVVVVRDPADTLVSLYTLLRSSRRTDESMNSFFKRTLKIGYQGVSIFEHVIDIWRALEDENDILVVCFESDLYPAKDHVNSTVSVNNQFYEDMASFLGEKEYNSKKLKEMAQIGYMVTNIQKFQNSFTRRKQIQKKLGTQPVIPAITNTPAQVSIKKLKEFRDLARQEWKKQVFPVTGLPSYGAFLKKVSSRRIAKTSDDKKTQKIDKNPSNADAKSERLNTGDNGVASTVKTTSITDEKNQQRSADLNEVEQAEVKVILENITADMGKSLAMPQQEGNISPTGVVNETANVLEIKHERKKTRTHSHMSLMSENDLQINTYIDQNELDEPMEITPRAVMGTSAGTVMSSVGLRSGSAIHTAAARTRGKDQTDDDWVKEIQIPTS